MRGPPGPRGVPGLPGTSQGRASARTPQFPENTHTHTHRHTHTHTGADGISHMPGPRGKLGPPGKKYPCLPMLDAVLDVRIIPLSMAGHWPSHGSSLLLSDRLMLLIAVTARARIKRVLVCERMCTHPPTHTHTHTHTHTERTRCRASGNTRSTCRAGAAWTKGNARAKGFPRDAWGAWPSWEAGSLWYSGETWSTRPPWKEKVRAGVARGEGFYGRLSSTGTTMGGVLFHWSCASCRLPASTIKHIRSLQIHLPVCFMMTWRIKS